MGKEKLGYEDFMKAVATENKEFVNEINALLIESGCKIKVELAKNGFVTSYTYQKPETKSTRTVINYVFRKTGMYIRIYAWNVNEYIGFMETLPDSMMKTIDKASVCKRMIDPEKCNAKCTMGFHFTIKNNEYKKCKNSCFMFLVNEETIPFLKTFIKREIEKVME